MADGKIAKIEVVDYGAQDEYGFFGKVVCKSDTKDMTVDEVKTEIAELEAMYPSHTVRLWEAIPALNTLRITT